MLIYLFVAQTIPVLRHEDNPYTVLGLRPDASLEDIQFAYEKLLRLYRDTDNDDLFSENLNKITEAYEILTNPDRRYIFDHYRITSHEKIKTTRQKATDFVSKIRNIGRGDFFREYNPNPVNYFTPLYVSQDPEGLLQLNDRCFVLAYSENDYNSSFDYGRAFESAALDFSPYFSFWRISLEHMGGWFFDAYKINHRPGVAYLKRNSQNKVVVKKTIRTTDKDILKKWITNLTPDHILKVSDVEEAAKWVKSEPYHTHIISFAYSETPPFFLRAMSFNYPTIRFAYLRNESALSHSKWNYTKFPTTLVFRGGNSFEYRGNISLNMLSGYYYSPFVWKLMWEHQNFLLYCGTRKYPFNYSLHVTITDPSSLFAWLINVKDGDWRYIDSNARLMYNIDENGDPVGKPVKLPFIGGLIAALSSSHIMTSNKQINWSIFIIIIGYIIHLCFRD
ncbi:DnaJ domain containing protein [Trichomonas vaginalis G3]|uniref:DnaJ domain containing protein n=1 Tax=Trichomonas vaginalis (strain ATCC PRA-98 / G3) TaxID=412133 RepID=A2DVY1_TRIV3|nr:DNAJ-like protein subfamily C member 16 family [Trichomonas vaginalis G3]EAY15426.1 DnaJ domain containing protein [Trichomonas vaginalis G3]KAI5499611.1 DNAJ-like protein subfamily C member 16 family [Trichomonas vaginalis G3]|eukprot:XP_001327649.1 DnaJ domain containing protein [Trichomonas vaginalis G3]